MIYLISQIAAFIVAACLLGLAVGWKLKSIKADKKSEEIEEKYKLKLAGQDKHHQQEIEEFAENAKKLRVEVSRLTTNNKALRDTIVKNNRALEIARNEISTLGWQLKQAEIPPDGLDNAMENLSVESERADEFDKTLIVQPDPLADNCINKDKFEDELIGDEKPADPGSSPEISINGLWSNIKDVAAGNEKK